MTTKHCPKCGYDRLSLNISRNTKTCTGCLYEFPWSLDEGQKPIFEGAATVKQSDFEKYQQRRMK